jgi:hypothetical protein
MAWHDLPHSKALLGLELLCQPPVTVTHAAVSGCVCALLIHDAQWESAADRMKL